MKPSFDLNRQQKRHGKPRVIILGAGRPYRGDKPSALVQTSGNKRTLDWVHNAFDLVMETEFYFVGGYGFDEIVKTYPNMYFSVNPDWENQGPLGSLWAAPLSRGQTTYVCYSDIVVSPDIVRLLRDTTGDVVLVADREWRHRYEGRSPQDIASAEKLRIVEGLVSGLDTCIPVDRTDAEFVGIMKLSSLAVDRLITLRERKSELAAYGTPRLIYEFLREGLDVVPAEVDGGWAELNAPQDLARFVLGTKADTLERLRPLVKKSVIGRQVTFTVGEWNQDKRRVIDHVRQSFGVCDVAVRSSALSEDTWISSNAGIFSSVLDVPASDAARVEAAVNRVIQSYDEENRDHQVLVQGMLTDLVGHGVVLTRTLNHGAPYYVLNFDDTSVDYESVTSGRGRHIRTVVVYRGFQTGPLLGDPLLSRVLEAVQEIEGHVGHDALDLEFAITDVDLVHVLQVRPIAINYGRGQIDDSTVDHALQTAAEEFQRRQLPGPFVLGKRAMFGIMPDWNPAEVIGPTPRRLALTLYQHLVTDEAWATQRAEYGYRDMRPHPLMVTFGGRPYIDVRACFNSFIPSDIPDALAERLVDYYLDLLADEPHLHDKVEFAVAFTCLDLDFDERSRGLLKAGFSEADLVTLRTALANITLQAPAHCKGQLEQIMILKSRFQRVKESELDPLVKAFTLIEDCRRYGTLPFAHLARSAFVAVSLLRSLEHSGITSKEQTDLFLNSLSTVSKTFQHDGWEVAEGVLSWDDFVDRYGHLRPGTYEVTSPSYAEEPEQYLKPNVRSKPSNNSLISSTAFWDCRTRERIQNAMLEAGIPWSTKDLEEFMRQAIEGREYAKFVFSGNLSAALDELVKFGKQVGVEREQLSDVGIKQLLELHTGTVVGDTGTWLRSQANEGDQWRRVSQALELPPLLVEMDDIFVFERNPSQPNFVTTLRVVAEAIELADLTADMPDLEGRIVLIPQADPGFDWLFGYHIAGLITMYGGANSHMTIRAAELDLPAAIGVGESLYEDLVGATVIDLDCAAEWIRLLR